MLFVYANRLWGHIYAPIWCVGLFSAKIRSTTQTHRPLLSTLEWARPPSAVHFIGIGSLFRNSLCVLSSSSVGWVLESILFLSSFLFSMFAAHGSVFTFTLHTNIRRIIIFAHVLEARAGGAAAAAAASESTCSFMTRRRSLNAQEKNKLNDVVWKSARMNLDGLCESFFFSRCIPFSCLCLESAPGYHIPSVAFTLFSNSVGKNENRSKEWRRKITFRPGKFLLLIESRNVKILQTICIRVSFSFIDTDTMHAPAAYCFVLNTERRKILAQILPERRTGGGSIENIYLWLHCRSCWSPFSFPILMMVI